MSIRIAASDAELGACFPVMHQLRPHLSRESFLSRVRSQTSQGYRIAYLEREGRPVAVAGFRFLETLVDGRYLLVDDLVTLDSARSRGHGAELLRWLCDHARSESCTGVQLDSGVQREDAHRFYEREGFARTAVHFERRIAERG